MIKSTIKKIILRLHKVAIQADNDNNLQIKLKNCKLGSNAVLYPESEIANLQKKSNLISIGNNSHIRGSLFICAYGGEIKIGNYSYISDFSRVWSGEKVSIGDNVLISHNVFITDTSSHEFEFDIRAQTFKNLISNGHPTGKSTIITKPIVIKDYVWINPNVIILPGVTIGKGAIVAAGAIVTKDVPDFTLVAGNPARIIRELDNRSKEERAN